MKNTEQKQKMNALQFFVLWLVSLLALGFFFYFFAPEKLATVQELLLRYAQSPNFYAGIFGIFFGVPFAMIAFAYTISKIVVSALLKGGKNTPYILLMTCAIIVQLSYYAVQYALETIL